MQRHIATTVRTEKQGVSMRGGIRENLLYLLQTGRWGEAFKKKMIYVLFLAVLGLRCGLGFSLAAASGSSSPAVAWVLPVAVAPLVEEQGP